MRKSVLWLTMWTTEFSAVGNVHFKTRMAILMLRLYLYHFGFIAPLRVLPFSDYSGKVFH